jgi:hypothetical protein
MGLPLVIEAKTPVRPPFPGSMGRTSNHEVYEECRNAKFVPNVPQEGEFFMACALPRPGSFFWRLEAADGVWKMN